MEGRTNNKSKRNAKFTPVNFTIFHFHNQVQIKMRATKKKLKIQNVQYLAVLSRENLGYYILNQDIFSIFFQHTHNLILLEIEYSSTTTATGI